MATTLTDTISPSGFDLFGRCEAAWQFRYVDGLKRPPSAAMAAGSAFDDTANDFYLERMAFGEHLTADETGDRFAAAFDTRKGDVEEWHDETPGRLLDDGVKAAATWRDRVGVHVEPEAVQPKVERAVELGPAHAEANAQLGLSNTLTLFGFADTIGRVPIGSNGDRRRTIIDTKFAKRGWSPARVMRETQPAVYALGLDIPAFQYHVARRGLKTPAVQVLSRVVTPADTGAMVMRFAITRRKIQAALTTGDFLPNRANALCSRKWCGYWQHCERRFGGDVCRG